MDREFLDVVMEALTDISRRLDALEEESAMDDEPEPPVAEPHPAGPNVIRFPTPVR
jgi:hypothetical protein